MNIEIERKFLLEDQLAFLTLQAEDTSIIVQNYLPEYQNRLVRLSHVKTIGKYERNGYYLSLKSKEALLTREEINTHISHDAYVGWLSFAGDRAQVIKVRKKFDFEGHRWEVDFFTQPSGLILAEIELESEEETFQLPTDILGPMTEVTGNPLYYNYNME